MISGTDQSSRKTTHATRKEPPPWDAATGGKRQMLPVPTAMPSMATNMPKRLVKKLTLRSVTTAPVLVLIGRCSFSRSAHAGRRRGRAPDVARLCGSGSDEPLAHPAHEVIRPDALLRERIAVAHRDRPVLHRLAIDRHAPRRARLVLPAVATADRARIVVERGDRGRAQRAVQLRRQLGHAVLL